MGEKPLAKAIREARLNVIYKNSPVGERKTEKKPEVIEAQVIESIAKNEQTRTEKV